MRLSELQPITEGTDHPLIVVDVQPEYCGFRDFESICSRVVDFAAQRTGPILMFVNAEDSGISEDTIPAIQEYWEERGFENWDQVEIVDKGYGHLRGWMDQDVPHNVIIKVIRLLYQNKENDSRDLFDEQDDPESYAQELLGITDPELVDIMLQEPLIVEWTSIAQLKKFNGAYLVGGGREECLREVQLLMNAFNIKYKTIDSLVYG